MAGGGGLSSLAAPVPSAPTSRDPVGRLTLRDALALPAMQRGLPAVAYGEHLLDRPVRWVHAGEASDIAALLSGGELLLTTGMGVGPTAADRRRFVASLGERGVAALVIELGAALPELPTAIVRAAHAAELPLVVLRRAIPFVRVTEALHARIVSADYALLRRGMEVHHQLTSVVLEGGGVPGVLAALAAMLDASVFLERSGQLLSHGAPEGAEIDPLELWEVARAGAEGTATRVVRVRASSDLAESRLLAVDVEPARHPLAEVALRRAAEVIALVLLRHAQEADLAIGVGADFLVNLTDGRLEPAGVASRARVAGFDDTTGQVLPLAAELRAPTELNAMEWLALAREGSRALRDAGLRALLGRRPGTARLLVVAGVRGTAERGAVADRTAAALARALAGKSETARFAVVCGRVCSLADAGRELRVAEQAAASVGAAGVPWSDVRDLELRRVLWLRRDDPELAAFVERTLGPLIAHDAARRPALLPTLRAFVEHRGHKTETARALPLNRQALYQRLTRIESVLGTDLGRPGAFGTLHVALCALDVLQSSAASGASRATTCVLPRPESRRSGGRFSRRDQRSSVP